MKWSLTTLAVLAISTLSSSALTIRVNYSLDTSGFFSASGNPLGATGALQARQAVEAAAARWSRIISTQLPAATFLDDNDDTRVSFNHPFTNQLYSISPAVSSASDVIVQANEPAADEYRGPWTLPADTIDLYVGARPQSELAGGVASTRIGIVFPEILNDINSPLNRGFASPPVGNILSISATGGSVSFNSIRNWHFDITSELEVDSEKIDFYSIALHEIGHILGMNTPSIQFNAVKSSSNYIGSSAVTAFNRFNSPSQSSLPLQSSNNEHWLNDGILTPIFPAGRPLYLGTVGRTGVQEACLDPDLKFRSMARPNQTRFELTYVDVAALDDLGWTTISDVIPPSEDALSISPDGDGDVTLMIASEPGKRYMIETSPNLSNFLFTDASFDGTGGIITWNDNGTTPDPYPPARTLPQKFYALYIEPIPDPLPAVIIATTKTVSGKKRTLPKLLECTSCACCTAQ